MHRPMHGTSCPKSQLKSTCLTAKFGSFLDLTETGEKGQNVISSSVQHPISLIFAIHVSFIIPLPMMWILLAKPMQKYVTTVCLHCSFARLKNKHIGVLSRDQCSHNKLATLVPRVWVYVSNNSSSDHTYVSSPSSEIYTWRLTLSQGSKLVINNSAPSLFKLTEVIPQWSLLPTEHHLKCFVM